MLYVDIALFVILAVIAVLILMRLSSQDTNGMRTVMIVFFLSELVVDVAWIAFLLASGNMVRDVTKMNLFFIYIFKLFAKIFFYRYINKHYKIRIKS